MFKYSNGGCLAVVTELFEGAAIATRWTIAHGSATYRAGAAITTFS